MIERTVIHFLIDRARIERRSEFWPKNSTFFDQSRIKSDQLKTWKLEFWKTSNFFAEKQLKTNFHDMKYIQMILEVFKKHIPLKFLEIFSLNSTQPKENIVNITQWVISNGHIT